MRPSNLFQLPRLLSSAATVVFKREAHPVALFQHANAGCFERTCMNKYVFAAVIRLDEAEALRGIEELYRAIRHDLAPPNEATKQDTVSLHARLRMENSRADLRSHLPAAGALPLRRRPRHS